MNAKTVDLGVGHTREGLGLYRGEEEAAAAAWEKRKARERGP